MADDLGARLTKTARVSVPQAKMQERFSYVGKLRQEHEMKLYLIYRADNPDCDEYDSAVVAADTENAARRIHPSGSNWEWSDKGWLWDYSIDNGWPPPSKIKVKEIGVAAPRNNERNLRFVQRLLAAKSATR